MIMFWKLKMHFSILHMTPLFGCKNILVFVLLTYVLGTPEKINCIFLYLFSLQRSMRACPPRRPTTAQRMAATSMTIRRTAMSATITTTGFPRQRWVTGSRLIRRRKLSAGSSNISSWALVTNIMPRAASLTSWSCSCSRSSLWLFRYSGVFQPLRSKTALCLSGCDDLQGVKKKRNKRCDCVMDEP